MAKLSKQEQAQLKALLDKQEAKDDPDDFEVWIMNPDGHQVKAPYSRARSFLKRAGLSLDDDDADGASDDDTDDDTDDDSDGDSGDESDDDGKDGKGKPSGKRTGYWGGKK